MTNLNGLTPGLCLATYDLIMIFEIMHLTRLGQDLTTFKEHLVIKTVRFNLEADIGKAN